MLDTLLKNAKETYMKDVICHAKVVLDTYSDNLSILDKLIQIAHDEYNYKKYKK